MIPIIPSNLIVIIGKFYLSNFLLNNILLDLFSYFLLVNGSISVYYIFNNIF
jgi:hypothetical protein